MHGLYFVSIDLYIPIIFIWVTMVILGLAVGSFLTCAVYRVPRGISVWTTRRSFCPHCHTQLRWFELVPLLSYLVQLGHCRTCHAPIGWRYAVIEAICLCCALAIAVFLTVF